MIASKRNIVLIEKLENLRRPNTKKSIKLPIKPKSIIKGGKIAFKKNSAFIFNCFSYKKNIFFLKVVSTDKCLSLFRQLNLKNEKINFIFYFYLMK